MAKNIRIEPVKLTSNTDNRKSYPVKISSEYTELFVQNISDDSLQADIKKIYSSHAVEEQLKDIKHMCGIYLSPANVNQVNSKIFVDFVIEVYACAEVKSPLRNAVARMLLSAPESLQHHILSSLSKRYALFLAKAQDILSLGNVCDVKSVDTVVSNIMMTMNNFPLGMQALQSQFKAVLSFLVKCLHAYNLALQVERAAAVREELHCYTHNAVRAVLLLLQSCIEKENNCVGKSGIGAMSNCHVKNNESAFEIHGLQLKNVLCLLLMQDDLPLEMRNTCALSLVVYCTLTNPETRYQLLLLAMGRGTPGWFPELSVIPASVSTRLALCVGLLGSLPVADLATPVDSFCVKGIPLALILQCLLDFANKKPSHPVVELGAARAMTQVLRIASSFFHISEIGVEFNSLVIHNDDLNKENIEDGSADMHATAIEEVKALVVDMSPSLLPVLWMQMEHSMDSIRHSARSSMQSFVHIAQTLESRGERSVGAALQASLKELAPFRRARYAALAAAAVTGGAGAWVAELVKEVGATPEFLLAAVVGKDTALRPHAAAAFEAVAAMELSNSGSEYWLQRWVQPLLCAAASASPTPEMQSLVGKAVAHCPEGVASLALEIFLPFVSASSAPDGTSPVATRQLHALLMCLYTARRHGAFDNLHDDGEENSDNIERKWKGMLPYHLLLCAAVHVCEEVRVSVLALVSEARRHSEIPSPGELHVVGVALVQLAASAPSPAARQQTVANLRRLLLRRPRPRDALAYSTFQSWLTRDALGSMFDSLALPAANHQRRNFCLQVIHSIIEEMKEEVPQVVWEPKNAKTLFYVLWDPYEDNKATALFLIQKFPSVSVGMEDKDFTISLIKLCSSLAQSIRPVDSVTAAYLLRLLVSFPEEEAVWTSVLHLRKELTLKPTELNINVGNKTYLQFLAVETFILLLKKQVVVAKDNIMVASVEGAMYGTVLCLRLLLEDCDVQSLIEETVWQELVAQLITFSYDALSAVEHIVNSASPEGHLPMDAQLFVEFQEDCGALAIGVPAAIARVSAQQVLLCSWRTVKEVSLLLGSLAIHTPGLLTGEQLAEMGQHFMKLLAEVKHRGAFEQVYVGFTQLCSQLWSLGKETVPHDNLKNIAPHELPAIWLNDLLMMVSSAGESNVGTALCVTRRSAGVPFLVQALLATEPASASGEASVFPRCMETLLQLVQERNSSEVRTHALNILRAVFRNAILCERTAPYIACAVKVAVSGCHGGTWSVRNAATLLFATLMTRLFGVPTAKDRQRLRRMTGRLFFHQYPTLYDFLLAELTPSQTSCSGNISFFSVEFEPYPVLLLLSRLYPSSLEGMDSNLQLSRFVPLVQACAGCSDERTRTLAARALAPLVAPTNWFSLFIQLLDAATIPVQATETNWNMCRGLLLQAVSLLQTFSCHLAQDKVLQEVASQHLDSSHWMLVLSLDKPNFLVAEAYIKVIQELSFSIFGKTELERPDNILFLEENISPIHRAWKKIQVTIKENLGTLEKNTCIVREPGYGLYVMRSAQLLLTLVKVCAPSELPSLLASLILSKLQEVAFTSLSFVLQIFKHASLTLPFEEDSEEEQRNTSANPFEVERSLRESYDLAHSIATLMFLPEQNLLPDMRLFCFQLLSFLPLILSWIIQLVGSSVLSEGDVESTEKIPSGRAILQWLLREFKKDPERVGPAVVSSLHVFFSAIEDKIMLNKHVLDVPLNLSDWQQMSASLELASAPESPEELRHSVACLITSPCVSKYLLLPGKLQAMTFLSVCHLWTVLLNLLDDEEAYVRHQATTFVLQLASSDTMPNMPVTEAKARELLVPAFVWVLSEKAPLYTAVTLTVWILQHCDRSVQELDTREDQLFEQSEANTFAEPALLAQVSSVALNRLCEQRPEVVNSPLPSDACTWLITRCWKGLFSSQEHTLTLQRVSSAIEQHLAASAAGVSEKRTFTPLYQPPCVRLEALQLKLFQNALLLPQPS